MTEKPPSGEAPDWTPKVPTASPPAVPAPAKTPKPAKSLDPMIAQAARDAKHKIRQADVLRWKAEEAIEADTVPAPDLNQLAFDPFNLSSPPECDSPADRFAAESADRSPPPTDPNPPRVDARGRVARRFAPADRSGPAGTSLTGPLAADRCRPVGRPTAYRPEFCPAVVAYMGQGLSLTAFGAEIGVSIATLYRWIESIPEFREAYENARAARTRTLEIGMLNAKTNPQVVARIFALKNAAPHEFRDKVEIEAKAEIDSASTVQLVDAAIRAAIESALPRMITQLTGSVASIKTTDSIIPGEFVEITKSVQSDVQPAVHSNSLISSG